MKNKIKKVLKEETKKLKKEKDSFFTDFKKFIMRGNVLDLAVAVVIATAFNAIVNGLVKYIITPFVTFFTSGVSINEWKYELKAAVLDSATGNVVKPAIEIQYGMWLQTIVDFLIIAFCIFVAVRLINNVKRKLDKKQIEEQKAAEEKKKAEEALAKEADDKAAAEKQAIVDEYYANVREQVALLREIKDKLNK